MVLRRTVILLGVEYVVMLSLPAVKPLLGARRAENSQTALRFGGRWKRVTGILNGHDGETRMQRWTKRKT